MLDTLPTPVVHPAAETAAPDLNAMGRAARLAARHLARLSSAEKDGLLRAIADALEGVAEDVLAQNALDVADARRRGATEALLDRLLLTPARLAGLAADARSVAALPDPVGAEIESRLLPNGMRLARRRTPIGVLGVIYEARPNVTIDIATLCLKTGNAVILRGGSETLRTNRALAALIRSVLEEHGLPAAAVQLIDSADRAYVAQLLRLDACVDMIIPRGGAALHKLCREQATIPVITGGMGICHLYLEPSANFEKALDIIVNAKTQRPSTCNTLDTLLVRRDAAEAFLPRLAQRMASVGVELRAAGQALNILRAANAGGKLVEAGPDDFDTEWLALILGVKIVEDIDEAIAHIADHSLEHSDGILTNDWAAATRFVNEVNSSAVFVNASTRFNDGGQFGLGAEVAVSTQKLHARGPMGLEALTTYKWIGVGDWIVRE